MGQQWKWGTQPSSTTVFENNLTGGNCNRLSTPLPGAPSNYNQYLSLFCRAAGDVFSFDTNINSSVLFANNTVYAYSNTVFDLACEVADGCDDTTWTFKNNILLGFINPSQTGGSDEAPGLFYIGDPSITYTSQYNDEFGVRNGDCPATDTSTGILCVSPGLFGQPTGTGSTFTESELDNFIPNPLATSPLLGAGVAIPGLTTDYNGASFTNPPAIGAFTYTSSSTPMPTP
jgi:hypothetical protein